MGVPVVLQRLTGVQYGHHIALHWRLEGHNLLIRGGLANLQGMQGRRTEEGIAAATVVAGTEDESGQCRCRWSQQIMTPQSSQGKAFGWAHLNGGNGFTGNAGRTVGLFVGAALPPPYGGCATAPVYLRQKGGKSGG